MKYVVYEKRPWSSEDREKVRNNPRTKNADTLKEVNLVPVGTVVLSREQLQDTDAVCQEIYELTGQNGEYQLRYGKGRWGWAVALEVEF